MPRITNPPLTPRRRESPFLCPASRKKLRGFLYRNGQDVSDFRDEPAVQPVPGNYRINDRIDHDKAGVGHFDGGLVPEIGDILPVSIEETPQLLPAGRTQKRAFTASRCQGWVCDPGPDTECLFYALPVSVLPERYLIVRRFSLSPSFGIISGYLSSHKWLQDDKRDALFCLDSPSSDRDSQLCLEQKI